MQCLESPAGKGLLRPQSPCGHLSDYSCEDDAEVLHRVVEDSAEVCTAVRTSGLSRIERPGRRRRLLAGGEFWEPVGWSHRGAQPREESPRSNRAEEPRAATAQPLQAAAPVPIRSRLRLGTEENRRGERRDRTWRGAGDSSPG